MQYVELDGQGETSHNFIMIMYQQLDEDQSVESYGRIKYGDGELCIWVGIGVSAKEIRSEEDMQSILFLWKLTPRVLLEPCLQMLKQMDKQAFDVSQYLSCDSISWDLTKVYSGNHIVPGPQEPGIAVSLTDLISSRSSEPPCFEGAIDSSITRYPPTTLDDSPLPPEPKCLEDVSALMASIPPFAGGDLNDSTIGHTQFRGHIIAIRWGRDPHTGELVLDVASGPPLPHGVVQDCQQFNLLHGTNHLSIEFKGYKVRSFVSISHPDESGMSKWLSHYLTQSAILQLIQKGRLERLEGLVSGNVTPADSATSQGTIADSRQALSESSQSPPSVSTQSKPSSQSWRSDASEWGSSIERLTRTSKL